MYDINKKETIGKALEELKKLLEKRSRSEEKIKKVQHILFKGLCPKKYLEDCEPVYCTFRVQDTCEYLKVLRRTFCAR